MGPGRDQTCDHWISVRQASAVRHVTSCAKSKKACKITQRAKKNEPLNGQEKKCCLLKSSAANNCQTLLTN